MAKAIRLPSGKYRAQIYIKDSASGKPIRKSFTANTKRDAEILANQYLADYDVFVSGTIGEAVDKYINNRSATLSPSTLRSYRAIQRNNLDAIKDRKLDDIHSEDVQVFINSIAGELSPKTVRNIYGLLKASIIASAPNKNINVRLPQKKVIERMIPTHDEVQMLLKNADNELRMCILLSAIGTMRIGEICALEYKDINDNVVHVSKDMVQNSSQQWEIRDVPKTSASDRYISYPESIIKELGCGEGRIIKSTPKAIGDRYSRLCKKTGVRSTRFHDLRHYAASEMHAMGIPDVYIMQIGGWSSDTVLKSVYRNVLDDRMKEFERVRLDTMTSHIL